MRKLFIAATAVALAACASSSKDIAASYVSPMQYQSFDCEQLGQETQRLTARIGQVGGRLDEAAKNDKMITTGGVILFWPALFFLGGTKEQEAEYGRLKGEYDAVSQAAINKKCIATQPLEAATPAPAAPTAEAATQPV
ncbi:MAG: hypothetical protein QM617_01845 [Comamonas sp.]